MMAKYVSSLLALVVRVKKSKGCSLIKYIDVRWENIAVRKEKFERSVQRT
jgi:hypothetical protein